MVESLCDLLVPEQPPVVCFTISSENCVKFSQVIAPGLNFDDNEKEMNHRKKHVFEPNNE